MSQGFAKQVNTDHGDLLGLTNDDHLQYLLLGGRAGSQSIHGSTVSGENLTLSSNTSNDGLVVLNDNVYNKGYIDIDEISSPSNPSSNIGRLYSRDSSGLTKLYFKDSAGTEYELITTIGGANKDIQVNDNGEFFGTSNFTYDRTISKLDLRGSATFNELGGDFDFRIEGNTDTYLFVVDASTDRIGISTNAPTAKVEILNNSVDSALLIRQAEVLGVNNESLKVSVDTDLSSSGANGAYFYTSYAHTNSSNSLVNIKNGNSSSLLKSLQIEDSGLSSAVLITKHNSGIAQQIFSSISSSNGVIGLCIDITNSIGSQDALITRRGSSMFNEYSGNFNFRVKGYSDSNLLFIDASIDGVGIGKVPVNKFDVSVGSNTSTLGIQFTQTDENTSAGTKSLFQNLCTVYPTAATTSIYSSFWNHITSSASCTENLNSIYGSFYEALHRGSGTLGSLYGCRFNLSALTGCGTINLAIGAMSDVNGFSGTTINSVYRFLSQGTTTNTSNSYGYYSQPNTGAINDYGLYINNPKNYLLGTLGIGVTTATKGELEVVGDIAVGGSNNELRFYEGVNYVGFEAPALTADQIWVLPDSDGTADQVLSTDGNGNLLWSDGGGGGSSDSFKIDSSGGTSSTYGTLTGVINGTNKVFTVSQSKYNVGSVMVYLNGQLQTQGTAGDWIETTPTSGILTFDIAPIIGDEIIVSYYYSV